MNALTFFFDIMVRSTLVLLVAVCASGLLRRSSAAIRHFIWTFATISLLFLPGLSLVLPPWKVSLLGALEGRWTSVVGISDTGHFDATETIPVIAGPFLDGVVSPSGLGRTPNPDLVRSELILSDPPSNGPSLPWATGLLIIWAVGALVFLIRLVSARRRLRAMVQRCHRRPDPRLSSTVVRIAEQLGIRSSVRVLVDPSDSMPLTWGVIEHTVVIPASAASWPEARLVRVLMHELAHVRRHDSLVQICAMLTRALYWVHPMAWMAVRNLRREAEGACDDVVLRGGARPSTYATDLLELTKACRTRPVFANASVSVLGGSSLRTRVHRVLDIGMSRAGLSGPGAFVVAVCGLIALGGASSLEGAGEEMAVRSADAGLEALGQARPAAEATGADTVVVQNAEAAWDAAWSIEATPILRVGDDPSRPGHNLARVVGALPLSDGSIVIGQAGANELQWFSRTGDLLATAGGMGYGPGQLASLSGVFRLSGDSVAAYDVIQSRLNFFSPEGTLTDWTHVARAAMSSVRSSPSTRFPDGSLLLGGSQGIAIGTEGPERVYRPPLGIYRVTSGETPGAPIAVLPGPELRVSAAPNSPTRFGQGPLSVFGRRTLVAASPTRWVSVDNAGYELHYWTPEGVLEVIATRSVDPRPLTSADRAAAIAGTADERTRSALQDAAERFPNDPPTMPTIAQLLMDPGGNVWAQDFSLPGEPEGAWNVFDSQGVWLGTLAAPVGLRILSIGAEELVGVTQETDGRTIVSVHRLVKP